MRSQCCTAKWNEIWFNVNCSCIIRQRNKPTFMEYAWLFWNMGLSRATAEFDSFYVLNVLKIWENLDKMRSKLNLFSLKRFDLIYRLYKPACTKFVYSYSAFFFLPLTNMFPWGLLCYIFFPYRALSISILLFLLSLSHSIFNSVLLRLFFCLSPNPACFKQISINKSIKSSLRTSQITFHYFFLRSERLSNMACNELINLWTNWSQSSEQP